MSLSHAESLRSFEAESRCCQLNKPLWRRANQKKSHMKKIEEITENSSSVRYFEFEKQQKEKGKIP